jgi:hypothetical protein
MPDVKATFSHKEVQSFPLVLGLNNKGGMDEDKFFEYLQNNITKLYPDAALVKGCWVIIKCDSGLGRLNPTLLALFAISWVYFLPWNPKY